MRSPRARAALLAITVLAVSPPIGAAAAAPASASYGQLVRQIDHGAVTRADIDSSRQRVTVTLKSGHSEVIALPAGARAALVGRLRSHGIRPLMVAPPKHVHHRLRYIAAGLVVGLALIGAAVWLYTRSATANSGDAPPSQLEPSR